MGDRQKFDHGILKEGFLGKAKLNKVSQLFSKKGKTGVFLSWNHGYWVLRSSLLFEGYKTANKSSRDLTKTFNLNHCENVNVCNFSGSKKTVYAFKLRIYSHGATKEYLFNAESERDRDTWVEMIVDLCDLSPDDDNYEWLDFNYTPNDRKLMTAKRQEQPPLPPIPRSLATLDPPDRPRMKPPVGQYEFASGSVEELSKVGAVGSYGFLTTMNRGDLTEQPPPPPPLPPPHSRSIMSMSSQEGLSSENDSDIDEYEENTFQPVKVPGGGEKGELVFQPPSDSVVQASFSRVALERPPIKPPIERSSPVPTPKWTHPADRPPMPLPSEVTHGHSARFSPPPPPLLKQLPPPLPPSMKPAPVRDPPLPLPAKMEEHFSHADVPQHSKQRPPPPPPTSAKPGQPKVSPPPLPVGGSRPLPLVQPPAGPTVPLPIPPRTVRESSNVPQLDSLKAAVVSVPVGGRSADPRPHTLTSGDRLDHGQPATSTPRMPSELERVLNKRRDVSEVTERPQPSPASPDRQARKMNEGKRPLTPQCMKSPTDSSSSRAAQAPLRNTRHVKSPPPDIAAKHWRHEDGTDDSGVSSDSGIPDHHGHGKDYYNTTDIDSKVALGAPGHYSFQQVLEDAQTPTSPVPNFPTPSPSWSEASTGSVSDRMLAGRPESVQSNQGSLDGRRLFANQRSPPRTVNEPIYVNWPVPDDVQREIERESASPTPPPPVRRCSYDSTDSRKGKPVTRGKSAAAADRMTVNPQPAITRELVGRSKGSDDAEESGPVPGPAVSRKPPAVSKKPRPEQSRSDPARTRPTSVVRPDAPSSPTASRAKFEQTRAGIASKIAMFQN